MRGHARRCPKRWLNSLLYALSCLLLLGPLFLAIAFATVHAADVLATAVDGASSQVGRRMQRAGRAANHRAPTNSNERHAWPP